MSISDEDLAWELYLARTARTPAARPDRFSGLALDTQDAYLDVAAKARELLTRDMQMPPFEVLEGGLKPGDVVSVRGVVSSDGGGVDVADRWQVPISALDPGAVTFIERPAPPEPDWSPGDFAVDSVDHFVWRNLGRLRGYWLNTLTGVTKVRDEIPGTLTPCDVVPREAK